MNREQVLSIAVTLLVPVVAAVVGTLAIAFQDWRVRRSLAGKRKMAFEDALRQVTFAGEWWKTTGALLGPSSEALPEARARATAWVDEASALVAQVGALRLPEPDRVSPIRRLLLLFPLRGWPAKVARVAYFMSLGWWLIEVGETMTNWLLEPENRGSWIFIRIIQPAIVALILRAVALSFGGAEDKPGGALLLRRLHGRPAVVVQLLFFTSLVLAYVQTMVFIQDVADFRTGAPEELARLMVLVAVALGLRSWALWIETTRPDSV